jgi:hypothetical protein
MSKKDECLHNGGYKMMDGELVCNLCEEPSKSKRWENNVFGNSAKAMAQRKTENKSVSPPDTK